MRSPESCHDPAACWGWSNCYALSDVAGEIATPTPGREPRSPPSGEHSAPAGIAAHAAVQRLAFVWLYCLCPTTLNTVAIITPETLISWYRRELEVFWRWKSRSRGGRPAMPKEIRELIREMSIGRDRGLVST